MSRSVSSPCLGVASLTAALGLAFATGCRAGEVDVQLLRDALRQNRDAIRTLHAKIDIAKPPPSDDPDAPISGMPLWAEWWQDGETIRYRQMRKDGAFDDRLRKNGVIRQLLTRVNPQKKTITDAVLRPDKDFDVFLISPWTVCLFNCSLLRGAPPMAAMLEAPFVQSVTRLEVGGRRLLKAAGRLSQDVPDMTFEIWIDPGRNHAVVKCVRRMTPGRDGRGDSETECSSFQEVKPGVFLPTRVEGHTYVHGRPEWTIRYTLSELRVNDPIDPKVFELPFPKRTSVADHFKGTVYVSDENERPTEIERPLPKPGPPPSELLYQTGDPRGERNHSRAPVYWATAGAIILAALIGWLTWSRRRRAAHV